MMWAHGFVCSFITVLIFSTYHRSAADTADLFPRDSQFHSLFGGDGWRRISQGEKKNDFLTIPGSQNWLESVKPRNAKGIRELTIRVEYGNINCTTKTLRIHKTKFYLGVRSNESNEINNYTANGTLDPSSKHLISTKLVPVNYLKLHILIKPPDANGCMVVYAVNVTYNFCRKKTFFIVTHFPKTYAPGTGDRPLKVQGWCSYGNKKPIAYCDSKGEWKVNETSSCNCAINEVMSTVGCIELSSIIEEVKAVRLSNTRAILSWKQKPLPHIRYKVLCKKCRNHKCDEGLESCSKSVHFVETKSETVGTNITNITGLERHHDYLFTVVGRIDVVNGHHSNRTSKNVSLRALPGEVKNLSFTAQNHDRVALTWLPPDNINTANISYEVDCRAHCLLNEPCAQNCGTLTFAPSRNKLVRTNVTITGFKNKGLRYVFKVMAKHRFDGNSEAFSRVEWNFVAINYTDYKQTISNVSNPFNVVDVIIGVSVLIFAVFVAIIGTRYYNRWKRRKHTLNFDSENPEDFTQCEVPLTDATRHYVDPSNYDSVENVLRKFTTKLHEKHLKTEVIIGEGEFGLVWKGYLEVAGKERKTVAVKCLRSGLSAKLRRDFLAEASVMGQFKDPNVISLHGIVVKKHTVKIVMEFMSNGSLDQYLLRNNGRLTTLQLLGMARGIASGMKYLSGRNFIHRDLAARNILVDENMSCKVADFGLTREICETSNYETRGGKIPIRWTAPEVIKHRKSFIASDVWSYGVVLWEIMSFGQRPYWEWDNFQVLQEIELGYRLPAPPKCPKTVHSLMLECWEKERAIRPTFAHILDKLNEWIRSPETIHHSPATKARRSTVEQVENQSPISKWLESIKMGRYVPNFTEAGYDHLSQVVTLTEQDLIDMGITLVGHRHKIHQSIPLVT